MRTSANGGISPAGLSRLVTLDMPRVASGLAIEAAWATAHLVMYPLGLLSAPTRTPHHGRRHHNLSGLTPEQRGLVHHDVDAAETPILLVHGIIDNHAIFTVMERALRRRGFQTLSAYDYGLLTHNIPRAAVRLGEAIEKLSAATGYERIHVIGHSLGGLIARYYVQRLAGDRHVHTLVTLGTPHQGTQLAWAAPLLPLVRQLTPNSSVIQELAEPRRGAAPASSRFTATSTISSCPAATPGSTIPTSTCETSQCAVSVISRWPTTIASLSPLLARCDSWITAEPEHHITLRPDKIWTGR